MPVILIDTANPLERDALNDMVRRLAGVTPKMELEIKVSRLAYQLDLHRNRLGGSRFVPKIERELCEARLELDGYLEPD